MVIGCSGQHWIMGRVTGILKDPQVKKLYRQLVREAERFPQYNYRMYALRKINDEFATRKALTPTDLEKFLHSGQGELERLKKMALVASLYSKDSLVIEKTQEDPSSSEKDA